MADLIDMMMAGPDFYYLIIYNKKADQLTGFYLIYILLVTIKTFEPALRDQFLG